MSFAERLARTFVRLSRVVHEDLATLPGRRKHAVQRFVDRATIPGIVVRVLSQLQIIAVDIDRCDVAQKYVGELSHEHVRLGWSARRRVVLAGHDAGSRFATPVLVRALQHREPEIDLDLLGDAGERCDEA